jgi:hypothetical protein
MFIVGESSYVSQQRFSIQEKSFAGGCGAGSMGSAWMPAEPPFLSWGAVEENFIVFDYLL